MRVTSLLTALASLVLLAGCDTNAPDEEQRNDVTDVPEAKPVEKPSLDTSQGAINAAKAPANLVEPPTISEEQQMLDDADATGLTSRLPEEYEALPPSSEGMNGSARQR